MRSKVTKFKITELTEFKITELKMMLNTHAVKSHESVVTVSSNRPGFGSRHCDHTFRQFGRLSHSADLGVEIVFGASVPRSWHSAVD